MTPDARHHLSSAEKRVLDLVEQVYREFTALPTGHPSDHGEVARHLHAIQKVIGARIAYRTDPDRFPIRDCPGQAQDVEQIEFPRGRHER